MPKIKWEYNLDHLTSTHLLDDTSPLAPLANSVSAALVFCRLAPDCSLGLGTVQAGRAMGGWQRPAAAEGARLGSGLKWREK